MRKHPYSRTPKQTITFNEETPRLIEGNLPLFRPNKKVRYAAGFVSLLESLPHKQMLSVIPGLMRHFSRRTYYRVRKGERPLSPSEQQVVLNALKRCGVKEPKDFDAYSRSTTGKPRKRGLCHYPCYGCAITVACVCHRSGTPLPSRWHNCANSMAHHWHHKVLLIKQLE